MRQSAKYKQKVKKFAAMGRSSVKHIVKLDVPTDIYTLPVGTEQKK